MASNQRDCVGMSKQFENFLDNCLSSKIYSQSINTTDARNSLSEMNLKKKKTFYQ